MKITFNKLSTKDLATLAQRVINASKEGDYKVVENHELLLDVEKQYTDYDKVYTKLTFSGKGQEVADADMARDKAFGVLKSFLRGYTALPSMPHHADAVALFNILQEFGLGLDRLNYSEQTAQMKKLIEELGKPENTEKLTNLNLVTAFDELKTAHVRFENLYAQQAEANADLRSLPSATTIRKNLQASLRNYFRLLTAMKNVPGWEMIYADINELVKGVKN